MAIYHDMRATVVAISYWVQNINFLYYHMLVEPKTEV
jgi:hypothetical protein